MTQQDFLDAFGAVTGVLTVFLGAIASISLLVGGIGIMNIMLVSVTERTKEIGTMKALGAKSADVLSLFMIEAALTGFIGGIIGASFGFVLGAFIGNWVGVSSAPTLILAILVIGFAVLTSVVSGLYPAWRASQLNPVEALRQE